MTKLLKRAIRYGRISPKYIKASLITRIGVKITVLSPQNISIVVK